MLRTGNELADILGEMLFFNKARLKFIGLFICSLIQTKTVNCAEIAKGMSGSTKKESKYRRIQRFFADFYPNLREVAGLILHLLPQKTDFMISLDRTEWQFGRFVINIFMAGIVYQGIAFPVVWMLLPREGNSNTRERIKLIKRLFRFVGKARIKGILGDREFIGKDWFTWLAVQKIPFYFRIKENAIITRFGKARPISVWFQSLAVGQSLVLKKRVRVYGCLVYVSVKRLSATVLLIVVSNQKADDPLSTYRLRWGIETLFGAFKSKGFNFEQTHLNRRDRIEKLIALMAIAFSWAHLMGQWLHHYKPIKTKKHRYKAHSFFRYGLDYIQHSLHNLDCLEKQFLLCLKVFQFGLDWKTSAKIVV